MSSETLLKSASEFAEKCYNSQHAPYIPDKSIILCLQALIMKESALKSSLLSAKERLYTLAADKYMKTLDTKSSDLEGTIQFAYKELISCQDFILNGPKSRNRTGNCVYFVAGYIQKEGGQNKNWKKRWLVVDDGGIGTNS